MKLHFDCFSGISGDMVLGALLDIGLHPQVLKKGLKALPIDGYRLEVSKVHRGHICATKADVKIRKAKSKPLSWSQIRRVITKSTLPSWVKEQSVAVFERLAEVEGKIHGQGSSKIHFHEVGVIDSLVDVVGGLLGFHFLDIKRFSSSPVNIGSGMCQCSHGTLPIPTPAVAELAKGSPVFSQGPKQELTTPTGMAILTTLTQEFCAFPFFIPEKIGYGAGSANPKEWPNVLRIFTASNEKSELENDQVVQLETNIDDLNPQIYEVVMDKLFEHGALDVTLTPITMKRSRPGIILSVLVRPEHAQEITQIIFQETSTIGLRTQIVNRVVLQRKTRKIQLPYGRVRVKSVIIGQQIKHIPEFEDCKAIAKKTGRSVREILQLVMKELPDLQ